MSTLWREALFAWRSLRSHRRFASLVVCCLALGIGVNSAMFSIVDRALLRPLPYPDPSRLVLLFDINQGAGSGFEESNVSAPNYLAWREQSHSFADLEAVDYESYNLSGKQPEHVAGAAVSPGFFDMLGVSPALGRAFRGDENQPDGPAVAVISHALWQRRYSADAKVLDSTLNVNGKSYTVVGVMPPQFHFLQKADLWVPLGIDATHQPQPASLHYLAVAGRLRRNVTIEQAEREIEDLAGRLAVEHRETNRGWSARVVSLRDSLVGDLRRGLITLAAAVSFILLIAVANVANLLLARGLERSGELAIRLALGASRRHLVRHLLAESLLLSLIAGAAGLLVARGLLAALRPLVAADSILLQGSDLDLRVLIFTLVTALLTGLLPGLIPAVATLSPRLYSPLEQSSQRTTEGVLGQRMQSTLVVVEVALAVVLLIGAGLMIKTLSRLHRTDPGFDADHVLLMQLSLPDWRYGQPEKIDAFWKDVLRRVEGLPGVITAGACNTIPLNDTRWSSNLSIEGRPPVVNESIVVNFRTMTPDFLHVLKVPLVAGRMLSESDGPSALPVAVISQEMARRYWGDHSPLGKRFQRIRKAAYNPPLTVVGVVGDVKDSALGAQLEPTFYLAMAQNPKLESYLAVRTLNSPLSLAAAVRRAIAEVDRDQPVDQVVTLAAWTSQSLAKQRFNTLVLALFATLGVALAAIGIYGLLSYAVGRRRHEIGVRMALGATRGDVLSLVLRRGMALALAGLAIGILAALASTRLIEGLLYDVTPTDPATFIEITLGILAVALFGSYLPARRAARIDPLTAFK